jgi:hypothetical protein
LIGGGVHTSRIGPTSNYRAGGHYRGTYEYNNAQQNGSKEGSIGKMFPVIDSHHTHRNTIMNNLNQSCENPEVYKNRSKSWKRPAVEEEFLPSSLRVPLRKE